MPNSLGFCEIGHSHKDEQFLKAIFGQLKVGDPLDLIGALVI
jgi:hypothetical protein